MLSSYIGPKISLDGVPILNTSPLSSKNKQSHQNRRSLLSALLLVADSILDTSQFPKSTLHPDWHFCSRDRLTIDLASVTMGDKRRVIATIHHRDEYSLQQHRARLGHTAYHLGLLIQPKVLDGPTSQAYFVTNGLKIEANGVDRNPNGDWRFQGKPNVNPLRSSRMIGRIMVGKVPNDVPSDQVAGLLQGVPIPRRGPVPDENCWTWTLSAMKVLQTHGFVENFDLNVFADAALEVADRWIKAPSPRNLHNYTKRPT